MVRRALLAPLLAAALAAGARADDPLSAIEVEGNERTARDVVVRALGVRPGDRVDDARLPELRQRVLNLRLFQEVEVAKRPAGAGPVLAVGVKERWTLIPIPIVGASSGAAQVGLALLETNLGGRHKLLGLSAIYSSRGQSGFLLYRDSAVLGTPLLLAAEVVAENKLRERAADGFDVAQAWRDRRVDASVRPGLLLAPRLALRAGPFAALRESRAEDGSPAPPRAGTEVGVAADLELEGQDYRDWFNAGPLVQATLRRALPGLGSARSFTLSTARAAWSVPVAGDHAASATVAAFLSAGDPLLDAFALGGRPGTRGFLTEGLWAERAASATLDYQMPVWRPGWGTMTAIGFVDAGVSRWAGDTTRWLNPGAGVRLYVRNVALPALGLDFAWSGAGGRVATSFFLGFR
jgi:outer membrane protein assembly factor BamA